MLKEYKRQFLCVAGKNTVAASLCINVAAGIGAYEQFCGKNITHVSDRHKVYNIFLIWTDHIVIRRILCDYVVNFLSEIGFLVIFHAVFEEIISVVLSSGGIFFVYKADVFLFPIRLCYIIEKHCSKFLQNDIKTIVLFAGTIDQCQFGTSGVIRIDIKVIRCMERTVIQEFHEHTTSRGNCDLYTVGAIICRIENLYVNSPVKTIPCDSMEIQRDFDTEHIAMFSGADCGEVVGYGSFGKLIAEAENRFYIFKRIWFEIKCDFQNSAAHTEPSQITDMGYLNKAVTAAESNPECMGIVSSRLEQYNTFGLDFFDIIFEINILYKNSRFYRTCCLGWWAEMVQMNI